MIVTFGEAMLRLTPPQHQRLENARSLDVAVGGAELNTAVGLARLGHDVSWVSALPDNPLGWRIRQAAQEAGIDISNVALSEDSRCGLYFLELGAAPRPSSVTYDRADSAFTQIEPGSSSFWSGRKPGTFDWSEIFDGASWFHLTGITPALGENVAAVCAEAISTARDMNVPVSFDINYRSKLWSHEEAARTLPALIRGCRVLFASLQDAQEIFCIKCDSFADAATKLCGKYQVKLVATTRRANVSTRQESYTGLASTSQESWETATHQVDVIDPLGAGDAFAAGVIHGLLNGKSATEAMEFGTAMGAFQHTIPGDFPCCTEDEILALLNAAPSRILR